MTPVNRMCKSCGRSIIVWNTAQSRCVKCQQARSKAKPPKPLPRATKPIKQVGRKGKEIAKAVKDWKKTQPANHEGYWECYMCRRWIPYLTAEHVKSKARHPDLRTDPANLKPTCDDCNRTKASNDN